MALVDIYARHADDGHAWIPKPIDKQGPLLNYDATLEEVYELLTIYPQVWIYDSSTKKAIHLSNLSEYFPDYDPGGGVTPDQLATALQGKVDKVTGKGLSTNDYTDDDKQKVQSALTKEQFDAGKTVTGTQYTIDNVTVTAGEHAEVFNDYERNIASGQFSHAEGGGTTASGDHSHAEGNTTTASGYCSHAEGSGVKALSTNQHVQGKYNIEDANDKYSFIIGNGTSNNARSNAFAIDWNGLIYQNNSENGVDLNQMSEKMNKTSTTWKGTQAEYDALESKSEYDMYCIYEDDET